MLFLSVLETSFAFYAHSRLHSPRLSAPITKFCWRNGWFHLVVQEYADSNTTIFLALENW